MIKSVFFFLKEFKKDINFFVIVEVERDCILVWLIVVIWLCKVCKFIAKLEWLYMFWIWVWIWEHVIFEDL